MTHYVATSNSTCSKNSKVTLGNAGVESEHEIHWVYKNEDFKKNDISQPPSQPLVPENTEKVPILNPEQTTPSYQSSRAAGQLSITA